MATASIRLNLDNHILEVDGQALLVEPVFGAVAGLPSALFNLGILDTTFPISFKTGAPELAVDVNVVSFSGTDSVLWTKEAGDWQIPPWRHTIVDDVDFNPSGRSYGRLLSETEFLMSTVFVLYLPELFRADPYLRDYFNAVGSEFDRFRAAMDMVLCALFVEDAPPWALEEWAEEVGFPQTDLTVEEWRQALHSELTEVAITQAEVLRIIEDFGALVETPALAYPADYEAQLTISGVTSSEVQKRVSIEAEVRRRFPAHILVRPVHWLADLPTVPLMVGLENLDGPPGGFDVSWDAPDSSGGFPLTYETRYKLSSDSSWTDGPEASDLDADIAPLTPGSAYDVQVRATNEVGEGPWSDSVSGTVDYSEPSVVRNLVLGRLSGGRIRASWTAPQYDGGVKLGSYDVRWRLVDDLGLTVAESDPEREWSVPVQSALTLYDIEAAALDYGTWEVAVRASNTVDDMGISSVFGAWTSGEVVAWTEPSAVTNMSVSAESLTSVRVSWAAPFDSGAGGIHSDPAYQFRYRLDDAELWTEFSVADGTTARTVSNLQRGRTYQFEVAAWNRVGYGPWTRREQTMGTGLPGAPATPSVVMGTTTASLRWTLDDDGGSDVVSYSVRYRTGSGAWTVVTASTALAHTVSGLSKNVAYEFQVQATNETGNSPWSGSVRGTTSTTVPAAPTGLTFATTRTTIAASWTAPSDTGGLPIEAYGFAILIDGQFDNGLTDSLSSHLFEDLQAGTYYEVRISARNSIGFGSSVVGTVTLPTAVPETPAVPTLSPSATALSVSWSAPFDSGLEITGYSVRYRTGTDAWTTEDVGQSLAYSIAGLEKNTSYEVQVRATNADGNSDWSESGSATTLWTLPGVPESVAVSSSGTTFFVLGWQPPSDTGGVTISKYEVRYRLSGSQFWTSVEVGLATSYRVGNRSAGQTYQFGVRVQNTATTDWGPWSAPGSVTLPSS